MRPVQVIAVSGGKGGVGKSNISVNLSIALAEMKRRVVLLDADLGLANVDVLLGLKATHTLADVLAGTHSLAQVLVTFWFENCTCFIRRTTNGRIKLFRTCRFN